MRITTGTKCTVAALGAAFLISAISYGGRGKHNEEDKDPLAELVDLSLWVESNRYQEECKTIKGKKNTVDTLQKGLNDALRRSGLKKEIIRQMIEMYSDMVKQGKAKKEHIELIAGENRDIVIKLTNDNSVEGAVLVIRGDNKQTGMVIGTLYINEKLGAGPGAVILAKMLSEVSRFETKVQNGILESREGSYTIAKLPEDGEEDETHTCVYDPTASNQKFEWKDETVNAGPVTSAPAEAGNPEVAAP